MQRELYSLRNLIRVDMFLEAPAGCPVSVAGQFSTWVIFLGYIDILNTSILMNLKTKSILDTAQLIGVGVSSDHVHDQTTSFSRLGGKFAAFSPT